MKIDNTVLLKSFIYALFGLLIVYFAYDGHRPIYSANIGAILFVIGCRLFKPKEAAKKSIKKELVGYFLLLFSFVVFVSVGLFLSISEPLAESGSMHSRAYNKDIAVVYDTEKKIVKMETDLLY